MKARGVREWLATLGDDAEVAIDDGGLMLVLVDNPDVYLEVGGVPRKLSPQGIFARQLFETACTMNRAAAGVEIPNDHKLVTNGFGWTNRNEVA